MIQYALPESVNAVPWLVSGIALFIHSIVLVLVVLGWDLILAGRRTAVLRCNMYLGLVAALLVLPLIHGRLPALPVAVLPAASSPGGEWSTRAAGAGIAHGGPFERHHPDATATRETSAAATPVSLARPTERAPETVGAAARVPVGDGGEAAAVATDRAAHPWWLWTLPAIYLAGVIALGARLLGGVLLLRRLSASAEPVTTPLWIGRLEDRRRELDVRRPVRLRCMEDLGVPMTFGWHRPTIMIPRSLADTRDDSLVDAILLHELGHVRRGDYLWRLLLRLVQIAYWPNPLIWPAGRRLQALQEDACDDLCTSRGTPSSYARALLAMAKRLQQSPLPRPAAWAGIAMARASRLQRRLNRVNASPPADCGFTGRPARVSLVAAVVALAAVISLLEPVPRAARAQEAAETAEATGPSVETDAEQEFPPLPSGAVTVTFDDGVRVSLLGVQDHLKAIRNERNWWSPDGTPLDDPLYCFAGLAVGTEVAYEFALRMDGVSDVDCRIEPPSGWDASRVLIPYAALAEEDGRRFFPRLKHLRSFVLYHDGGRVPQVSVGFKVYLAAGPWHEVQRIGPYPWEERGEIASIESLGSFVMLPPRQQGDNTIVSVIHVYTEDATRVVMTDQAGRLHVPDREERGGSGRGIVQLSYHFEGFTLADVAEIIFQRRPFDRWVEFRDVPLEPGGRPHVQVTHRHITVPSGVAERAAPATRDARE